MSRVILNAYILVKASTNLWPYAVVMRWSVVTS